ncbi:PBP1A family penicillin-binding protein [Candidatus Weimeria sp. HCP3S3_B5]|uniref:transglycosylase domain-containing protein n=1 Tax=Candidatus Weimeria sp. HCP3S3_B5 TaxID=3438871 RepID=UPI003F8AE29D
MSRRKKKRRSRAWGFLWFQLVVLGLIIAAVGVYYGSGFGSKVSRLKNEAQYLVDNSTKETFRTDETGVAYDSDGKVISTLKRDKDVRYLTYDEIPVEVRQAIVSIEDKKFYEHHGVDFKAIMRAAVSLVKHNGEIKQGGSTITMQLARNVFLTQKRTWQRKIEEIFISLALEKKYSKHQILEFYLNNVYFGNGYYGIEAASQGYFRKDAVDLDTSQVAFLCGLPNAPNRYDPRKNLPAALKRRDRVLLNMKEDSILSQSEYQDAVNEEIKIKKEKGYYHNYMETFVYYCATRALMDTDGFEFQYDFSSKAERKAYQARYKQEYQKWYNKLFTGGYRIYTSLDRKKQDELQKSINDGLASFTEKSGKKIYKTQGAGVCIDNQTGAVVAIVGGRSQNLTGYTLNRAFQSYRQPGSSIKPLVVYTPALENGYTPNTMVDDHKFEGGPSNAGDSYHGKITMREAVERSLNTVAWQIFDKLTPKVGISYLYKMDFSNIVQSDETLAASLGGLTNGVSPLEMAKAYATIENDGAYRDPSCVTRITTSDGTKVWENDHKESVVYSQDSARQMTDILQGVFTSGWGTGRSLKLGNMPCAGKTGTTNDYKDGWFCGYTPYYTTAIWVGNDTPVRIYGLQGASYPGHIWQSFMLKVIKDEKEKSKSFPKPVKVTGEIREDISDDDADKAEKELEEKKKQEEQQNQAASNNQNNTTNTTNGTTNGTDNSNTGNTDNTGGDSGNTGNSDNKNNSGNKGDGSTGGDESGSDEPETPPVDERDDDE